MTDRIVIANNELDIDFDKLNFPDAYNGSEKVGVTNEETGRFRILKYRLYKNENFSDTDPFLTLKKDITRSGFSISGNLRRWWFGWESTIQDLNKKQYKQCINHIAKRLRLSKTEFWESRVTYVEIGGNIRLPKEYEFIISAMVSFPQLKSCKFGIETASFKNRQRDVISYNKFRQLYDNRVINKRVFEVLNEKIFVLRFEVKLKIPSASSVRTQVNTLRNIKNNWDTLIDHWEDTFYKIKINKIQNLKISATDKGLTRREFKDYCLALAVQEYGIDTINNVINTNFTRKHSEERKHVLEICRKYADKNSVQYVQDVYNAVAKKACRLKRLS